MGWNAADNFLARYRASKIMKHIPEKSTVLDFGCGEGRLLFGMAEHIGKGVGIDRKVKNYDDGKIRLIHADLEKGLPLKENIFDAVIFLAVLEHLNNPSGALNEIHRVLKKGGKLLLTAPTPKSKPLLEFLAFKLRVICREEIEDHKHYWDRDELIEILKKSGFKEIDHKYFQLGFNQVVVATK